VNIVMASFNIVMGHMTEMYQRKQKPTLTLLYSLKYLNRVRSKLTARPPHPEILRSRANWKT